MWDMKKFLMTDTHTEYITKVSFDKSEVKT